MTMSKLLLGLVILSQFAVAQVQSPSEEKAVALFNKRFKVERDSAGVLQAVTAKFAVQSFAFDPIIDLIRRQIQTITASQSLIGGEDYSTAVDLVIKDLYALKARDLHATSLGLQSSVGPGDWGAGSGTDPKNDEIANLHQSLLNLPKMNADTLIAQVKASPFWTQFKNDLGKAFAVIRPDIISAPTNPKYFFQKDVVGNIAKTILDQVAKRVTSVPLLGTFAYVFSSVQGMVADQRTFNQNYLLYLIETFPKANFGMTEKELNGLLSSLYQSRLGLTQYFQLQQITAKWESYGWGEFYLVRRGATAQLNKFEDAGVYDATLTKRLGQVFAQVKEGEKNKIINLVDRAHQFSSKPSLAYNLDKPNAVMTTRLLIRLGQFGLSFLPIPGIIKNQVDNFASSVYKQQSLTEGSLIAYFDLAGNEKFAQLILGQTSNPFLK